MKKFLSLVMLLLFLTSCKSVKSTENLKVVDNFEIERYMGKWHEIARLPNKFEDGLDFCYAVYNLNSDGTVKVFNCGYDSDLEEESVTGVAKFKGANDIGFLRVSFFRPFYGDYKIIMLDKNYQTAVVCGSRYDYLWILSRKPYIQDEILNEYITKIKALGFDTNKLYFPKQQNSWVFDLR